MGTEAMDMKHLVYLFLWVPEMIQGHVIYPGFRSIARRDVGDSRSPKLLGLFSSLFLQEPSLHSGHVSHDDHHYYDPHHHDLHHDDPYPDLHHYGKRSAEPEATPGYRGYGPHGYGYGHHYHGHHHHHHHCDYFGHGHYHCHEEISYS